LVVQYNTITISLCTRYGESWLYKVWYILVQEALNPLLSSAMMVRLLLEDIRQLAAPDSQLLAAATFRMQR